MVVRSSNDFSTEGMISWDVNSAVVPDETIVHFHAAIMVERASDGAIPEVCISGSGPHIPVGLFNGGHDHCSEVLWRQDYDLVVVVLPLIVICSLREKVCLFVGGAGLMMEGKMVLC